MKLNEIMTLIANMVYEGATDEEFERIIRYSMAVLDAEKVRKVYNIDELTAKY